MAIIEDRVKQVKSEKALFDFLRQELAWPVTGEPDTYSFLADELGLTDEEANQIKAVRQIAPFAKDQPWGIFLVEFNGDKVYRGALRKVLRGLSETRRDRDASLPAWKAPNLLFICTPDFKEFSFARFEGHTHTKATLSIFGWDAEGNGLHTLCADNLPALHYPADSSDAALWLADWAKAWSVEAITQRFYDAYEETFKKVEHLIKGVQGDKRLFTQRLFNRLMFLQFLSKKGWLRFPSSSDKGYLAALWEGRDQKADFYTAHICPLFFTALNSPHVHSLKSSDSGLYSRIGEVPYLNGGLFRKADNLETDRALDLAGETVEGEAFDLIINTLFPRFNFTVDESTSVEVEVAVDPEMLGRVFEKLVTERHEIGAYYTPRPVVSFMCREALKGYLAGGHGKVPPAIAAFVDNGDASGLNDPEATLEALKRVTVCDPACGSGAYLVGMMQELLRLREKLFVANVKDFKRIYDRKLEIIERNLYGADKNHFAVNVAMLRLWLSLVVDDKREPLDNPTVDVALPNLRYKIQVGDSLTAPAPDMSGLTLQQQEYMEDADSLSRLHHRYFNLKRHGQDANNKELLEADIATAQEKIKGLFGDDVPDSATDWRSAFAEVFAPRVSTSTLDQGQMAFVNEAQSQQTFLEPAEGGGGFHIILANPPYVRADPQFKHLSGNEKARQGAIAEYKAYRADLIKSRIYTTLYEKWDMYIPFLERAYQILQPGGSMIFIIPDAYNASKYTTRSHEFFLQHTRVERIDFCSEIDLFDAGVNNTILYFVKTRTDGNHAPMRVRRWGDDRQRFEDHAEVLPTLPQVEFGATLFKPNGERNVKTETTTLGQLCYVSYGLRPCSDAGSGSETFQSKDVISDFKDKAHPVLYIENRDIIKWAIQNIHYLEWNTGRAPSLYARQTFPKFYSVPERIVAAKVSGDTPRAVYDDHQLVHNDSLCGFVLWHHLAGIKNKSIRKTAKYRSEVKPSDVPPALYREQLEEESKQFNLKYLLGVMNSEYAKGWIAARRRNKLQLYPDDWKGLPIAPATAAEQAEIVALVQKCLDARGVGCEAWEAEINKRVAALYGL